MRRECEKLAGDIEVGCCVARSHESVVSDLDEAWRKDVEEESSDEFSGRERYGSFKAGVVVVSCQEGDLTIIHFHEAVVGDGHLVRVESEVSEDLSGPPNGCLA